MRASEALPPNLAATSDATPKPSQIHLDELVEAIVARDNFIAVAGHELRNPMTPMIGQLERLISGVKGGKLTTAQIEERLERVHRAMGHYVKRAATLLDVSRITTGKFRLQPAPCDLVAVIVQVVDYFAEAAQYSGAAIELDVPASLPGHWDRLALEQVMDNLVSNAIKYGGPHPILVSAGNAADSNALGVLIQVRDHGPGISAENRARIFGRFERAVGLDQQKSGFGIGLWVVGQIVDAMDGIVEVDAAEGGGSVFRVALPRK